MKTTAFSTALLAAALTAGCGSKTDPNEKNFGAALSQYLEKKGELCLGFSKWPIDVTETDLRLEKTMPSGTAGRMAALERAGLVSSAMTEIEEKSYITGTPMKFTVKRYTVTEAGKNYYREWEVDSFRSDGVKKVKLGDLCYGRKALQKVVKWEGPMKLGDYQEAGVTYLYKIDGLSDWAKRPEIQATFPTIPRTLEGAGKTLQTHGVKLTSEGWEANGLN
ncbi:hypothetical protein [Cupriavidus sp. IK-TO18]|uniref:hypothetical protein n=1 Tax=Cupriavidus sp. IK-TO18 TaxID=2782182 RepID=UPI00189A8451|nr:hypothetical protein [Cupriavidus sp. IK-TO18]MBF6989470.1 hypothetical protein [Cupriavidus sp. IK-TO18]